MRALPFTLKTRPDQRVDMSPLVCHALENLEPIEIAAIKLHCGKRKVRVDELCTISGFDTKHIQIKNSFSKLDYIGKDLDGGIIHVEGDAGAYCGMGMKKGFIKVFGNAVIYAGCEMKKGHLKNAEEAIRAFEKKKPNSIKRLMIALDQNIATAYA